MSPDSHVKQVTKLELCPVQQKSQVNKKNPPKIQGSRLLGGWLGLCPLYVMHPLVNKNTKLVFFSQKHVENSFFFKYKKPNSNK